MRILHTESSLGWGGQEIRILRESAGMRERGHSVVIAAHPDSRLLLNSHKEGFETLSVAFRRRNFLRIIPFLKEFIEKESMDVVNTHSSKDSWLALPAARLAKNRPLVIRTRHLSTPIGSNLLSRFLYNTLPHIIITTSIAIKEQMININKFSPDKIISIPTGVDTNEFNPEESRVNIRKELHIEPLTPLIGTVSVIRSWKGLDYLVKAVPPVLIRFPDARFIIAGDGIHKKTLENTIKETGVEDKIYLLGHREDIADILYSLNILVHPSYANEGVPQTILQAMAMGKPVIASDLDPLKEVVVDDETGLLSRIKDPESIADCIIRLLENKESSDRLAGNGRNLVSKSYSFAGMIDRLETLYSKSEANS